MAECSKKNACINYPDKCVDCGANSDIYNHYPCYKEVEEVEVVRCSQCRKRYTKECALQFGFFVCCLSFDDDFFCAYGEKK